MNILDMPFRRARVFACCLIPLLGVLLFTAVMAGGDEAESAEVAGHVEIWLDDWRDDLPPGVSLIVKGGQLINKSFPAISADKSQIAVLYYAGPPVMQGYPTLDIYSTTTLLLESRTEFFPEHRRFIKIHRTDPDLLDSDVVENVNRGVLEANRKLARNGFSSMEALFELPRSGPLNGVERLGKRIDYPGFQDKPRLTISSVFNGRVELEMMMPYEFVSHEGASEEVCGRSAEPQQGWYDTELGILVLRVVSSSSQDGCELPEQWFLKRLDHP